MSAAVAAPPGDAGRWAGEPDHGAGALLSEDKENQHSQESASVAPSERGKAGGFKAQAAKRRSLGGGLLKASELYDACIRLANENKINVKNSWELKLIDHMDAFLNDNGKDVNFQKASCTLDATMKIYSCRVDSVHSEAYKVLSNLSLAKSTDEGKRDGEDGAEGDDGEGGSGGRGKRAAARGPEETLESGEDALRGGERDAAFAVDPLFRKMAASFDEGGARGLLLNALPVGTIGRDFCRVVFDSGDVMGGGEEAAAGVERPPAPPPVDISDLAELFAAVAGRLEALEICPAFAELREGKEAEVLAAEAARANGGAARVEAGEGEPRSTPRRSRASLGAHLPDTEGEEDEEDAAEDPGAGQAMDFGFGGDGPPPEPLAEPASGGFDEPFPEDSGEEGEGGGGDEGAAGVRLAAAVEGVEAPTFPQWKFRARQAAKAAAEAEAAPKRKRRVRGEFRVAWAEALPEGWDERAKRSLKLSAASLKRHEKASTGGVQTKEESMPPRSIGATSVTLLARPHVTLADAPPPREAAEGAAGDAIFLRPDEGPAPPPDAGPACEGDDDDEDAYGGEVDFGAAGFEEVAEGAPEGPPQPGAGAEPGLDVVPVPRKVGRLAINFARVAKRVDVRALKENMWREIEASDGGSLQGLCGSVPARMRPEQAAQVSISFFFICLLHLANEKCLALRGCPRLGDVAIGRDKPEGDGDAAE